VASWRVLCVKRGAVMHPYPHAHVTGVGTGDRSDWADMRWTLDQVIAAMDAVGASLCSVIIVLSVLSATYGVVILGLVLLLRTTGVSSTRALIVAFWIFGAVTGALVAQAWRIDSSIYPNVWAAFPGDWVYHLSTEYLGAPWLLQVPRV